MPQSGPPAWPVPGATRLGAWCQPRRGNPARGRRCRSAARRRKRSSPVHWWPRYRALARPDAHRPVPGGCRWPPRAGTASAPAWPGRWTPTAQPGQPGRERPAGPPPPATPALRVPLAFRPPAARTAPSPDLRTPTAASDAALPAARLTAARHRSPRQRQALPQIARLDPSRSPPTEPRLMHASGSSSRGD
jgi:hypothetical protein